jgi:hypothetical protein
MTAVKRKPPVRSPKNKPATGRTKWHLHTKNLTQGFKKTLLPSEIIALQLSQREIESALSLLCSQPTAAARQLGRPRAGRMCRRGPDNIGRTTHYLAAEAPAGFDASELTTGMTAAFTHNGNSRKAA